MLEETGLVTKVEDNIAWVNTRSKLACSSCKVESTCGNGILEKYLSGRIFVSKVQNTISAKVGDQVVIAIPQASVTKAALVVYCIPLLGIICGALFGELGYGSEPVAIGASLVGLISGLFVIQIYNRKIGGNEHYMPKIVSKIVSKAPIDVIPSILETIKIKNID